MINVYFENKLKKYLNFLISNGSLNFIIFYTFFLKNLHSYFSKYYKLFLFVRNAQNLKFFPQFIQEKINNQNLPVLIISLSLWGDKYIHLFNNFFLPSFLPNATVDEISKSRLIIVNLYTSSNYMLIIKTIIENKKYDLNNIIFNIIDTGNDIINMYNLADNNFKYTLYGAFHICDLVISKKMNADFLPIAPDGVHSFNSLSNYINLLDSGYNVLLLTGLRIQAETSIPTIEKYYDYKNNSLTINGAELTSIAANNIHHEFRRYFLFNCNNKIPETMSLRIYPYENYFKMNSYHLHPILISSRLLKNISKLSYDTVDAGIINHLNVDSKSYIDKIKVIDDSNIGCMVDLSYLYPNISLGVFVDNIYSYEFANSQKKIFNKEINLFNFDADILFLSYKKLNYRTFENENGKLIECNIDL